VDGRNKSGHERENVKLTVFSEPLAPLSSFGQGLGRARRAAVPGIAQATEQIDIAHVISGQILKAYGVPKSLNCNVLRTWDAKMGKDTTDKKLNLKGLLIRDVSLTLTYIERTNIT
jgi:hypothetical protein